MLKAQEMAAKVKEESTEAEPVSGGPEKEHANEHVQEPSRQVNDEPAEEPNAHPSGKPSKEPQNNPESGNTCPYCDKNFSGKSARALQTHVGMSHKGAAKIKKEQATESVTEMAWKPAKQRSNVSQNDVLAEGGSKKRLLCPYCEKEYTGKSLRALQTHIGIAHKAELKLKKEGEAAGKAGPSQPAKGGGRKEAQKSSSSTSSSSSSSKVRSPSPVNLPTAKKGQALRSSSNSLPPEGENTELKEDKEQQSQETAGEGQSVSDDGTPKTAPCLQSSFVEDSHHDSQEESKGAANTCRIDTRTRSHLSSSSPADTKTRPRPRDVPKIVPCVVEGCDYKASTKSNMVKHVTRNHKAVEGALAKAMSSKNYVYSITCERCGQEIRINNRVRHASKCLKNEVDERAKLAQVRRLAKSADVDPKHMPWEDVLHYFKRSICSNATNLRGNTAKQYWAQLVKFLEWRREQDPHFNPLLCLRGEQEFPSFEGYLEAKDGMITHGCLIHLMCGYMKACSLINDELVRVAQGDPTKRKTAIDLGSLIKMQLDQARERLKKLKSKLKTEAIQQDKDLENVYTVLEVVKLWLDSNERKQLMEEGEKHKFKVRHHPLQFLSFNLL